MISGISPTKKAGMLPSLYKALIDNNQDREVQKQTSLSYFRMEVPTGHRLCMGGSASLINDRFIIAKGSFSVYFHSLRNLKLLF